MNIEIKLNFNEIINLENYIEYKKTGFLYKLIGVGLSITYAVQTVLTIGGAIKFIPSTGVTLPLISYGGSSVLCTIIMFGVFQGISVHAFDDEENISRENRIPRCGL